jgi:membrane associated rhomboid family serine protease
MVFPIADDNSDRRLVPYVNYALIAINALVFVLLQGMGSNEEFTLAWATVPHEIVTGKDEETPARIEFDRQTERRHRHPAVHKSPLAIYLTLLTSMFMHGGIAHILGNMWFLWIFGDNIEDAVGHLRYVIFYLVCGLIASLAHVLVTVLLYGADSLQAMVPSLGASGAISGVLGAYLLLFPQRPVTAIVFRILTTVPAYVAIGVWFVFQLVSGLGMLGGRQSDGVAYAAHIGGFVAGLVLIKLFTPAGDWREVAPERGPPPLDPDDRW